MFLTFEGIEGSGKSSQLSRLADHLAGRGVPVTATREPGGSPVGGALRALLLSETYAVAPATELLLYAAERAEHVARVVRPALERGRWVLCDRYGDATRAYQCWGRGLRRADVEAVHALATGGLEPDLTLWLRLDPDLSLSRARARDAARGRGEGRFEAEALAFHHRVAQGYAALAEESPARILPVDASGDEDAVAARILSALESRGALPR